MSGTTIVCRLEPASRQGRAAADVVDARADEQGRLPRMTRLTALAIHWERELAEGRAANAAALARRGRVSRARVSQIISLLFLAPDIQEDLLFLPRTRRGRDPIPLWRVLPITRIAEWTRQRPRWRRLRQEAYPAPAVVGPPRCSDTLAPPRASRVRVERPPRSAAPSSLVGGPLP